MRFKSKFKLKQRVGERRIVRKFLFLPRHFGEDEECRWLEWAYIEEKIKEVRWKWEWREVGFVSNLEIEIEKEKGK